MISARGLRGLADITRLFAEGRCIPGVSFDSEYRSEHCRAELIEAAIIGEQRIVLGRVSIDGRHGDYFVARFDDAGAPRGSQFSSPVYGNALEDYEQRVATARKEMGS